MAKTGEQATSSGEPVYLTLAEVAQRWRLAPTKAGRKTAAKIIRKHNRTAILRLSQNVVRVAVKDVLAIEREIRRCGELDLSPNEPEAGGGAPAPVDDRGRRRRART
jgi:hypothetical protein